jgi:hypothetical protein
LPTVAFFGEPLDHRHGAGRRFGVGGRDRHGPVVFHVDGEAGSLMIWRMFFPRSR